MVDEGIVLELVKPGAGELVADGDVGEVVVTLLHNRAYPLVRFATGDLSAFLDSAGSCGRSNRRIKGWLGRADQTAKIKGMFVHPAQIPPSARAIGAGAFAPGVVERVNDLDHMTCTPRCRQRRRAAPGGWPTACAELTKLKGRCACARRAARPTTARLLTTSVRWPDHTEARAPRPPGRITLAGRYAPTRIGRHCMTATFTYRSAADSGRICRVRHHAMAMWSTWHPGAAGPRAVRHGR